MWSMSGCDCCDPCGEGCDGVTDYDIHDFLMMSQNMQFFISDFDMELG